jgi:hypothetical protein
MTSITLYNKGKRVWTLKNAAGADEQVKPEGSIEMEEATGLRMLVDYPREFTSSKIAGPSSEDLARREQSLKDRSANLDEREAKIASAEKALESKISALPNDASMADVAKRGPGRPKASASTHAGEPDGE